MITTAWFFGEDDLAEVHAIRRAVFIDEQQIDEAAEMDGTDAACVHLVAYADDLPVATGRIMITREAFLIGRVAVLSDYRNRQLGTLIVRMLIRACTTMGGERQTVHAQVPVQGFYEKLGFVACGPVYMEAGIPHITMEHIGDITTDCSACDTCSTRCFSTDAQTNVPVHSS